MTFRRGEQVRTEDGRVGEILLVDRDGGENSGAGAHQHQGRTDTLEKVERTEPRGASRPAEGKEAEHGAGIDASLRVPSSAIAQPRLFCGGSFRASRVAMVLVRHLVGGRHGRLSLLLEKMPWIDAFANAAIVCRASGRSRRSTLRGGKLFAGLYALYSGLAVIVAAGLILAPVVHSRAPPVSCEVGGRVANHDDATDMTGRDGSGPDNPEYFGVGSDRALELNATNRRGCQERQADEPPRHKSTKRRTRLKGKVN